MCDPVVSVCRPPRLSLSLSSSSRVTTQSSRPVWSEGPLHLLSPGCAALCSKMMSLRIPSGGPLSAHKMPFLQLNTYGLSAFQLLLYHPPPHPVAFCFPDLPTFPLPSCFSIRKDRHITHGTRPKRHPQVSRTQSPLSGTFPQL